MLQNLFCLHQRSTFSEMLLGQPRQPRSLHALNTFSIMQIEITFTDVDDALRFLIQVLLYFLWIRIWIFITDGAGDGLTHDDALLSVAVFAGVCLVLKENAAVFHGSWHEILRSAEETVLSVFDSITAKLRHHFWLLHPIFKAHHRWRKTQWYLQKILC